MNDSSGPSTSGVIPALRPHPQSTVPFAKLIAALGVVYGDIGTSPLYALKECVNGPHGVAPTPENVLGVVSLIFWSLTLVVVLKYLVFVLRADNNGEGGVLALMALVSPTTGIVSPRRLKASLAYLGLFGAALLYGDGMLTPAVTVLSAVEGLSVATPLLQPVVVPITCVVLVLLFVIQRRGTAGIGAITGPVMLIWFTSIAVAALPAIARRPDILWALNPAYGVHFFINNGWHGYLVLGAVVLCVTGGEALYADMGHFGRRAIRIAWYAFAMPALVINYFGQGANLLADPTASTNPFYALTPGMALYPMLAIATLASVVASQALITGAFSITRQAMQMGYSPRMTIVHTSEKERGQIYIPSINWMLMLACLWLVLTFQSSSALAAAYGISVTGTMAITSVLFYAAARERWEWTKWQAGILVGLFLVIDVAFLGANLLKILHGGWVPLVVAGIVFSIMTTWRRGRRILGERMASTTLPLKLFLADVDRTGPYRVPGTAVFMTSTRRGTPGVLLHHFKHNKVLHEKVVILTIVTDDVPKVEKRHRIHFREFGTNFWAVTAHYGFMETARISEILRLCRQLGLDLREEQCSFFLGRETLVPGRVRAMAGWRRRLFSFLSRNARPPTDFFGLPPNRVLELGMQIEL
jgi:KUP system potassium uptake protein